jgi:dissimilatory sulfite reductase related protein
MTIVSPQGKVVDINEEGFMSRPQEWDRGVAEALAKDQEGIESLSREHWAVIEFIRAYYLEHGNAPMVRNLCQSTHSTLRGIYELFPSGPAKGACKLAGLPKPDGCV